LTAVRRQVGHLDLNGILDSGTGSTVSLLLTAIYAHAGAIVRTYKVSALGVEEQRVNVVADLLTPPDKRRNVDDAFRVEARIIVWKARDTLKAPVGALFRKGEQWAAFVVADGHARLRIVKVGRSSGTETQVLEGLKQGEEVILYPGSRVRDGQRVTPVTL
jgi:HlyD family secretion protein